MVFDGIAADLVSKMAARFLKNFDSKNVDIALLAGDIRLTNVELNPEALDTYNVPVCIKGGLIGEVRIDIPWSSLKSKPTTVQVDRVCIVFGTEWNMDRFIERDRAVKAREIIRHAKKVKAAHDGNSGTPPSPEEEKAFKPSMLSDILFNVRININDIHIRFEDDFSNTWHPWAVGLTIESITLETTSPPQERGVIRRERYVTKLLEISTCSLYWDSDTLIRDWSPAVLADMLGAWMPRRGQPANHSYVMKPVNVQAEVALRKTSHARPTVDLKASVTERVEMCLHRKQYDDAIAFIAFLRNYGKTRKCLGLRPRVRPRDDPRGWWVYAVRSVVHYVRYCTRRFAWKHVVLEAIRRDAYCQAYEYYLAGRDKAAAVLVRLEDAMAPDEILRYRTQVETRMRRAGNEISADRDGNVFIVGFGTAPVDPVAEWQHELEAETALHTVKGAPSLSAVARKKMLALKEALLGTRNPLKLKAELNVRESVFALVDSHQTEVLSSLFQGVRTTLAVRVNSTKLDCTVDNAEARLQNWAARAQVLSRLQPPGPEAGGDPSWGGPLLRLTLEVVRAKERGPTLLQRLLGRAAQDGDDADAVRDEWAILLALGPLDLFLYGPLLLELQHMLHRPWPEFVYRQWPRTYRSKVLRAARPAKETDHSIKLVLGGARVKVMLEQPLAALFFQPEGTLYLPAMEATYSSRDYPSAFGFLRNTALARTPLLASFLGAAGTDAHRDDAGGRLAQLAHSGALPGPAFQDDELSDEAEQDDSSRGRDDDRARRAALQARLAAQAAGAANPPLPPPAPSPRPPVPQRPPPRPDIPQHAPSMPPPRQPPPAQQRVAAMQRAATAPQGVVQRLEMRAAAAAEAMQAAVAIGGPRGTKAGPVERRVRFGLLEVWRARWMVLLEGQLSCFLAPEELGRGRPPQDAYGYRDILSMAAGGPDGEPADFALRVRCSDDSHSSPAGDVRTLYFRCADPADAADWMRCLAFKGVALAPGADLGGPAPPPAPVVAFEARPAPAGPAGPAAPLALQGLGPTTPRPSSGGSVHGTGRTAGAGAPLAASASYAAPGQRVGPLGYPVGTRPGGRGGGVAATQGGEAGLSRSSSFDQFLAGGPPPSARGAPHGPLHGSRSGAVGRAASLKPGEGSTSRYPGQQMPPGPDGRVHATVGARPPPAMPGGGPGALNSVYGAYGGARFASHR